MKKFKRILTMFIGLVALILCFSINTHAEGEPDVNHKVTMKVNCNANGHIISNNGTSLIEFTGSSSMVGTATIYYTTQDYTAVSAFGDYTKTSGSVTISAKNNYQSVLLNVGKTNFSVKASVYDAEYKNVVDKIDHLKSFYFVITEVVYNDGTLEIEKTYSSGDTIETTRTPFLKTDNKFICDMEYKYNLRAIGQGYWKASKEEYGLLSYDDIDNKQRIAKDFNVNNTSLSEVYFGDSELTNDWINKYVNTGIADVYAGLQISKIDRNFSTDNSSLSIQHGYKIYFKVELKDAWLNEGNTMWYSTYHNGNSTDYSLYTLPGYLLDYYDQTYRDFYGVRLTDKTKTNNTNSLCGVNVYVDNSGPIADLSGTYIIEETAIDLTGPYAIAAHGLSNNITASDGKVRIAVKFNEPVQLLPALKDNFYVKATFSDIDRYLKYVDGEGTDTLIFELDENDAIPAFSEEFTIEKFYTKNSNGIGYKESKGIFDYSTYFNHMEFKKVQGQTDFDFSEPKIVDVSTTKETSYANSRLFNVEIDSISNGTLYYLFSEEDHLTTPLAADKSNLAEYISQFQGTISVKDSTQLLNIASLDADGNGFNSPQYLHLYLISSNGYDAKWSSSSSYKFDSTNPKITYNGVTDSGNLKSKTYSFTLEDANLKIVTLDGVKKSSPLYDYIWVNGESKDLSFTIHSTDLDLEEDSYGYFDFNITAIDEAENETIYTIFNQYFDTRNVMDLSETKVDANEISISLLNGETLQEEVVSYVENSTKITYSFIDDTQYPDKNLAIKYLKFGNKVIIDLDNGINNTSPNVSITKTGEPVRSITLTPNTTGYMEVVFIVAEEEEITSNCYSYYFTNNLQDETVNATAIQNGTSVKNYVYSLGSVKYNYIDSDGKKAEDTYIDGGLSPVFSSKSKAFDYVQYFEYQDMQVIYLDDSAESKNIIRWLMNNSSSTGYSSAVGETVTPESGQYWVRYKSANWNYGADTKAWVYYYLSNTSGLIDINSLSNNLRNALAEVCKYIVSYGSYKYYTGEGKIDNYGSPDIRSEQIIANDISVNSTYAARKQAEAYNATKRSDQPEMVPSAAYKVDLTLTRDKNLFDSKYKDNGIEYPLLMHYIVDYTSDPSARFFYKKNDSDDWTPIRYLGDTQLDSVFKGMSSGIYQLLELGYNGANAFKIYLDLSSPEVCIQYKNAYDTAFKPETATPITNMNNGSLAYTNVRFVTFKDSDEYAYIHITKTTGEVVYDCLLKDFVPNKINLNDGNYILFISDRYGNSIQAPLNIKNTEIDVVTEKVGDSYYSIEVTNRTAAEIASYEVKLNGKLYSSTFTKTLSIYESGSIDIYIKDIYGFIWKTESDEPIEFVRSLPDAEWSYHENQKMVSYDKENPSETSLMSLTSIDDEHTMYQIKTSVALECSFPKKYTFQFVGDEPEYTSSTDGYSRNYITFNSLSGWTLEIYYPGDPSCKVTYICSCDSTAPEVNVYYETSSFIPEGLKDMNLDDMEIGTMIPISSSRFEEQPDSKKKIYIKNGETSVASNIQLNVSDVNDIRNLVITLDGVIVANYDRNKGNVDPSLLQISIALSEDSGLYELTPIMLSGSGNYVITATDLFGNVNEFKFTNSNTMNITRTVDGKDSSKSSMVYYGMEEDAIVLQSNGSITYSINGKIYSFYINENGVYELSYIVVDNKKGGKTWSQYIGNPIFLKNSDTYFENMWYSYEDSQIQIIYRENAFVFKIVAADHSTTVNYTYNPELYSETIPFVSILSKEFTNVPLINVNKDGSITTNENEELILVHDEFKIDITNLSDLVECVEFGYSDTSIHKEEFELKPVDLTTGALETVSDGFYLLKITNKFGNVLYYSISKFVDINVETKVEYASGVINGYTAAYEGNIYSNKSVVVTLYSNQPYQLFTIEKLVNDVYVDAEILIQETVNTYSITLDTAGIYRVTVIDEFGNMVLRNIEIASSPIAYKDAYVIGFNEGAGKYYSNSLLSIDKEAIDKDGIVYVQVDDIVVYDTISEKNPILDDTLLIHAIGSIDNRKDYTVVFRNKYGDECSIVLHYSFYTTLGVYRNYQADSVYEKQEIKDIIYTNNAIKLVVDTPNCELYVDGQKMDVIDHNYEIIFSYASDGNYATRHIVYKDYYGFSHEFDVTIIRQDIDINVLTDSNMMEINNLLTINGSFQLSYTNDSKCTYSINDEGKNSYDDQVISKPGIYYFTVVDMFGNQKSLRIKLDNICEYDFTSNSSSVFFGQVLEGNVTFSGLNNDTVSIASITKDGKEYELTNNAFVDHGFYHVVVKDEIGNESEFEFYIIKNKINHFKYEVPTGYVITEIFVEQVVGYKDKYTNFDSTGFDISTDGKYTVVMKSVDTDVTYSFGFTIDNTPPKATLSGVENLGITKSNVVITGLERGDTVEIYRGGQLYGTYEIDGQNSITITEAGNYSVVITNEAGIQKELTFKKSFVMNTAGSVLIVVVLVALSTMLLVGLMLRKRSKVDK